MTTQPDEAPVNDGGLTAVQRIRLDALVLAQEYLAFKTRQDQDITPIIDAARRIETYIWEGQR